MLKIEEIYLDLVKLGRETSLLWRYLSHAGLPRAGMLVFSTVSGKATSEGSVELVSRKHWLKWIVLHGLPAATRCGAVEPQAQCS